MAKCKVCGKEMLTADGCLKTMHANGKRYERIPVGGKGDFLKAPRLIPTAEIVAL